MLLSKNVIININPTTKKYYEDLGYQLPYRYDKRGRLTTPRNCEIKVKVKDLKLNSMAKIKVQCDCCNIIYDLPYYKYIKQNHNGKIYCTHCAGKMLRLGKNNPNYNFNLTDKEREEKRKNIRYAYWVQQILSNYNYTCYNCNKKGDLNAHHLYSWKDYPNLRYDTNNGVCLCKKCHFQFHTIYGRGNNTKEQFIEWLNKDLSQIIENKEIKTSRPAIRLEDGLLIYSVDNFAKETYGISGGGDIREVCNNKRNEYKGNHYMWYDEYLQMSQEDINKKLQTKNRGNYKYVIYPEEKIIFESLISASKYFNITSSAIVRRLKKNNSLYYLDNLNDIKNIQEYKIL